MNTAARAVAQSQLEINSMLAGLISRRHVLVILLALAVFVSGFSVIVTKNKQRRLFIESQQLSAQAEQMQVTWGKLLLEQGTLARQGRIERIAANKLNMVVPNARSIVMVQE